MKKLLFATLFITSSAHLLGMTAESKAVATDPDFDHSRLFQLQDEQGNITYDGDLITALDHAETPHQQITAIKNIITYLKEKNIEPNKLIEQVATIIIKNKIDLKKSKITTIIHQSVLHCAAADKDDDPVVVKILCEAGLEVTIKDLLHEIPLHCAARAGNATICRVLLERDPKMVNFKTLIGLTPLICAAQKKVGSCEEVFLVLREYKAAPHATDNNRWTALRWAQHKQNKKNIAALEKLG